MSELVHSAPCFPKTISFTFLCDRVSPRCSSCSQTLGLKAILGAGITDIYYPLGSSLLSLFFKGFRKILTAKVSSGPAVFLDLYCPKCARGWS